MALGLFKTKDTDDQSMKVNSDSDKEMPELKLAKFDRYTIRSLRGAILSRGVEGASGGLITLWNDELFSVKVWISNRRCIILVGELRNLKKEVVFCNVYAASIESERKDLREFLHVTQQTFQAPWFVGGDFNTVLDSTERFDVSYDMCSIIRFNNFILKIRVVDILLHGSRFTWSNNREREA
ncbi:hypothetical protein Dsin_001838 [Dipteronia sinensis]|uniref:Endonuclease/exonuclease/phosphatase domain-containing protein n=1 Tax=Dipteronia sinensis TaxID=43782 RepID=A0AAE0EJD4_9ROSI|nr:hypothetical protein Dsin_001838 [Dipteronia sinensis]